MIKNWIASLLMALFVLGCAQSVLPAQRDFIQRFINDRTIFGDGERGQVVSDHGSQAYCRDKRLRGSAKSLIAEAGGLRTDYDDEYVYQMAFDFYPPTDALTPPATFAVTATPTTRQIVLHYTAPSTSACTVEASEESDYTPLVNDVNPALRSGSNSDARAGSLGAGTTARTFVLGTIPLDNGHPYPSRGDDGKDYSWTLQVSTTHYIRVTCGADTGTASVMTLTPQPGRTYQENRPIYDAGAYAFPTIDTNRATGRNKTYIDPVFGTLLKPAAMLRDYISDDILNQTFTTASGTGWTSPANVIADDGNSAVYSGTGQDWLFIDSPTLNIGASNDLFAIKFYIKANATGSGDNAVLQICLTNDGATCLSDIKEITLSSTANTQHCYPHGAASTDCGSTPTEQNMWRSPQPLYTKDVNLKTSYGVLVRKKGTGAGDISLQFAKQDWLSDTFPIGNNGGFQRFCAYGTVSDSSGTPGYLCRIKHFAAADTTHWFNPVNGEMRYLGRVVVRGHPNYNTSYVFTETAMWDPSNPRVAYVMLTDTSGKLTLVKMEYPASGNTYYDASVAVGTNATASFTTLSTGGITAEIAAFDGSYVEANWGFCSLKTIQLGHVIGACLRGTQDSTAFIWAFDLASNNIVASGKSWTNPKARYCGLHSAPAADHDSPWVWLGFSELRNDGSGNAYLTTLAADIPSHSDGDTLTITVSGEPTSSLNPTQNAAVGDVINIDNETFLITTKHSSTSWSVLSGYGFQLPQTHSSGASIRMACNAVNWGVDGSQAADSWWKFQSDAFMADATNTNFKHDYEQGNAGTHEGYHWPYRIGVTGIFAVGGSDSSHDPTAGSHYGYSDSPPFAGIARVVSGNDHQHHPTPGGNVLQALVSRKYGADILPLVSHVGFNPIAPTRLSGAIWKFTNFDGLERKRLATMASSGAYPMRDISSAATGDQMTAAADMSYCVPEAANECWPGSTVGEIYVKANYFGPVSISDATNASPIVLTTTSSHGYVDNSFNGLPVQTVRISGVSGNTAANGDFNVTYLSPTTFSLNSSTGNGAYTSGGTAALIPKCTGGGETRAVEKDGRNYVCIGDTPAYSQLLVELRLDRPDVSGGGYLEGRNGRTLSHLFTGYDQLGSGFSPYWATAGGWMFVPTNPLHRSSDVMLIKMPPAAVEDGIDRTTFIQRTVILSGPGPATSAIIEWGYNPSFHCRSRLEACVSAASNAPYFRAGESFTRISCPAGACAPSIPILPDRIAYWRAKYYDSGGSLIETSATQVITDGSAGAPTGVTVCSWNTNPACVSQ